MLDLTQISNSVANPTLWAVGYSFLLSFILGSLIAVLYMRTFNGLSYSRNFLHCLVLCPILTAIAMQAIGDNVARGIGMIGTISMLRIRTNVKDPRDMFFIFASLAVGLACGVHSYSIAVAGALCFCIAAGVLSITGFSSGPQFDGLIRLNVPSKNDSQRTLESALTKHCKSFSLISLREMSQGEILDYAYHIKLKKGALGADLLKEIKSIPDSQAVALMMQESIIEV